MRGREQVGERAAGEGLRERGAEAADEAGGVGARGRGRHLLAEHGPHRELVGRRAARDATARRRVDQRAQHGVGAQRGVDGHGIGVEVEDAPGQRDRRRLVVGNAQVQFGGTTPPVGGGSTSTPGPPGSRTVRR